MRGLHIGQFMMALYKVYIVLEELEEEKGNVEVKGRVGEEDTGLEETRCGV